MLKQLVAKSEAPSPALLAEVGKSAAHAINHLWLVGAQKLVSVRVVAVFHDGQRVAQERAYPDNVQGDLLDAPASRDPIFSQHSEQGGAMSHKFVWSTPISTYTLSAVCEYCGLVAFNGNLFEDSPAHLKAQEEAKKPCPNAPVDGTAKK